MVRSLQRVATSWLLFAIHSTIAVSPAALANEVVDDGDVIEEIVVTGSHEALASGKTPVPVVVIRREDIAASGSNSIADLARHLTINSGVPNDAALQLTPIAGASFFNLRGLGAQNTLVLVNGKRVSPYGASQTNGQTIVDINAIPLGAVDRIEIVKDGASAVYGSDAIAGVVNIVLKRRMDGLRVGTAYLTTSRGDHDETVLDATWGAARERTNLLATASYFARSRLQSVDRDFLADADLRSVGGYNNRSTHSSPMSALRLVLDELHADPACPQDPHNPLVFYEPFPRPNPRLKSTCRFNFKLFTDAIPASDRLGVASILEHTLDGNTSLAVDLFASHASTRLRLPPDPTDKTPLDTPFPMVAADHPFNPFDEPLAINYRAMDADTRKRRARADAGRIAAALDRAGHTWTLQLSALAAYSSTAVIDFNVIDAVAFQEALLGRGGDDGATYYNPFGLDPANPDHVMRAFTVAETHREEIFRERSVDFSARRRVGRFAGGPVGVVLGAQFRDQKIRGVADSFQQNGLALALDLLRPFDARRRIHAAYAEFSIPLFESLDVQVAARHEHYSDFGSSTNPKVAILWRANERLAVRTSWGTSFRAPAFGELYRSPREFLSIVRDTLRCDLIGTPLECSRFPYRTFAGGNPDLQPEKSRSLYVGISLGRRSAGDALLDLAWWQLDQDDRIIEPGASFIIDQFGEDPDFVRRSDPTPLDPPGVPGPIESINSLAFNIESLLTRGIDLDLALLPAAGRFDLRIGATYLDRYRVSDPASNGRELELAGRAMLFPLPRLRANASLRWPNDLGDWTLAVRYTGAYWSPRNLVIDGEESKDIRYRIDDHATVDLQYARALGEQDGTVFRVGCRNCLDADPPDYNYTTIGENLHDPRGAVAYVRFDVQFR